ncbi:alcohol dehydrogenase [Burkholderia multivorans]|uniref:alcohol dehydrogenase n=1 Tax=Burkholderia multivorans TaxID=87883 RepID=UPI001C22D11F|nr:alcohol dehydrogenase [Burkholderia multivorans]MBU9475446.1 alcohol dehydrogenase [Burkholderia multivorans]
MFSYDVIEHGKPLQVKLRETPVPKGREVLIRITHAGLCHSDIHLWEGYFDMGGGKKAMLSERGLRPPLTLGHEPLGTIVACGEDVIESAVGRKKLVFPWIGCGTCRACEIGRANLCVKPRNIGIATPGAFASHLLVPDEKYLVDVDGLDDAFAATLACSGLTSYAAVARLPQPHAGDWVAVIGCGGVGMSAISILRARGVENVIACDVDEAKLAAARELGATKTLRSNHDEAGAELFASTEGRLAGAIDFVGMPGTFALANTALCKGGMYVIVGLHGGELSIPMPPIAQRSLAIVGSFVGTLADLKETVRLAKSGQLLSPPLCTRRANEINDAFDDLSSGRVLGRTVLDFSGLEETAA